MPGPQGLANAPFAFAHERDQTLASVTPALALSFDQGMAEVFGAPKEEVIEAFKFPSLLSIKSSAAEADHVQPADAIIATSNGVGGEVFANGRSALHQRQRPNSHKLVDQAIARNEYAIVDADVTAKERAVRDDHVVTHPNIMAQVAMGHEKVVRTNHSRLGRIGRTVDGNVFAENVALTNTQAGWFAAVFDVLRRLTQNGASIDVIVCANVRYTGDVNVRADAAIRPNRYGFIDDRVRANHNRRVNLGLRMDDRGLMDHE